MIIGHLPAGYLLAQGLRRGFDTEPLMWWAIIAGSVAPDLDMIWFYLVDGGTVHHHSYLTHNPLLWSGILCAGLLTGGRALSGLGIGGVLHMALDTIVGPIRWGVGAFGVTGPLIEVPATQDHWVLSFVLYWTFLIEILLLVVALLVFWLSRRTARI